MMKEHKEISLKIHEEQLIPLKIFERRLERQR